MDNLLIGIVLLISFRVIVEVLLLQLNYHHATRNLNNIPDLLKPVYNSEIAKISIEYLGARSKIGIVELIYKGCLLVLLLLLGIPKAIFNSELISSLTSAFTRSIFVFICIYLFSLFSIPFDLYREFKIEKKFGFLTMSFNLWFIDFLKGTVISFIISVPIITLFIYVFEKFEKIWVLIFWVCFVLIQLVLMFIGPKIILPLFNKFEKLPDGELKIELIELTKKAKFSIASIEIMDESKRTRHSNAFFTGIGRNRKIVIFDTLLRQLSPKEIVAIVAHEIGHYKLGHLIKYLTLSSIIGLVGLIGMDFVFRNPTFFCIFGISTPKPEIGVFLIAVLGHEIGFWISPLINTISRRWEYEADKYAVDLIGDSGSFVSALVKLSAENRSNVFPHPLFSKIYYSHPVLLERIKAIIQRNRSNK